MRGYRLKEVQKLLELSEGQLRTLLAAGWVRPRRDPDRTLRLDFQDLVVLRTAKGLLARKLSPRRIRRALAALRAQLPEGADLSRLRITAHGDELVVGAADELFAPESGQRVFDFAIGELTEKVAPLARQALAETAKDPEVDAQVWYRLGAELDGSAPLQAKEAYSRAIELDPRHLAAHIDLGRLLHEAGELAAAAARYQAALTIEPQHPVALFNLGVVREDLGQAEAAVAAYRASIAVDPGQADAHHNLGQLLLRLGEPKAALRHLAASRRLSR